MNDEAGSKPNEEIIIGDMLAKSVWGRVEEKEKDG